jgi:biopolymer transport protein ExbD
MPQRSQNRTEEAFQMAPMIDMVFLLLVFFMTVSTLAKDARPELELAVSTTAAVPEEAPPRDVVTVVRADGEFQFFWHNREVSAGELAGLLEKSAREGGQLLLRGSPDLPWEAWEEVMDACRSAGIDDIVFATFED